ncbi:MAG: TnpV protein, partial [Clostridia bacterium]|nr:TnpV protein [Clostridia bacterium]
MQMLVSSFQLSAILTVLYQASGSVQNLHTIHLLRIRKDDAIMKNITYRQVGDFNIPNLILPPEEANITLGKWGMLHKDYL